VTVCHTPLSTVVTMYTIMMRLTQPEPYTQPDKLSVPSSSL